MRLIAIMVALVWATLGHAAAPQPAASDKLLKHQRQFDKAEVIKISDRVYVAYNYSMCNIIMIIGDDGVAIYDTGFRVDTSEEAVEALSEVSDLPIKHIIYSHGHADHVGGAKAFSDAAGDDVQIHAQANHPRYVAEVNSPLSKSFTLRAVKQMGMLLPEGHEGTVGTGGGKALSLAGELSYVKPTNLIEEAQEIDLGGVTIQMFRAPGDLDDGLAVWIPEEKVLLTGDSVVGTGTWPILSTPRHEKGRDARAYVATLNKFQDYPAEVMIGGHGRPIRGLKESQDLILRTRMIAQYMIDETLRHIQADQSYDAMAETVTVPDAMKGDWVFDEYYHRLSWIMRGIYVKEAGWFSGDSLDLVAHGPRARSTRMIALAGGKDKFFTQARKAYNAGDFRWSAELADTLLRVEPGNEDAITLKAWSMKALAYEADSANERNFLITESNMLTGDLDSSVILFGAMRKIGEFFGGPNIRANAAHAPASVFVEALGVSLNVERSLDADMSVELVLTDRDFRQLVTVQNGVMLQESPGRREPALTVSLSHEQLYLVSENKLDMAELYDDGDISVTGNPDDFARFASWFAKE